jgi:protein TonB
VNLPIMKILPDELFPAQPANQDKLVRWCLIGSVVIHVVGFVVASFTDTFEMPQPVVEEWSIDTELVTDLDMGASNQTVLPGAKESDEVSVPSNMLPQVTKKFTTKEKTKQEEGLKEEPIDPELDKGRNETEDTADDSPPVKPEPDVATRLEKQEALKRMALERLRKEQKEKSRELKAHKDDKLAKIREALQNGAALDKNVGGLMASAESKRYQSYLRKAIRRSYSLPKTYEYSSPHSNVVLEMRINARGELLAVDIRKSSGDEVLDSYCIEAVKRSAPYEPPPKMLAGRQIGLSFKP